MRKNTTAPVLFRYGGRYETRCFRTPMDALAYAIDRSASVAVDWTIEWCSAKWEDPDYHPDGRRKLKGDL